MVVLGFYTSEDYMHEVCSMGSSLDKVAAGNVHIHEFGYLAPDKMDTSSDTLVVEEVVMSLCTWAKHITHGRNPYHSILDRATHNCFRTSQLCIRK